MAESDDWHTPPETFGGLRQGGLSIFDVDPAHPGRDHPFVYVPAKEIYTKADDGLRQIWRGEAATAGAAIATVLARSRGPPTKQNRPPGSAPGGRSVFWLQSKEPKGWMS